MGEAATSDHRQREKENNRSKRIRAGIICFCSVVLLTAVLFVAGGRFLKSGPVTDPVGEQNAQPSQATCLSDPASIPVFSGSDYIERNGNVFFARGKSRIAKS